MIIIKIGGAEGIDYDAVVDDLAALWEEKKEIILVHGGKNELDTISSQLGKEPKWIKTPSGFTSRRTDRETMDLFTMVYAGKMNKMLVEKLQKRAVNAVGLCGMDGKLFVAKKKDLLIVENGKKKMLRDDYTGKIIEVNKELLQLLLQNRFLPVVCPPAISEENEALNVDGDRMAAMLAEAFQAEMVLYLSNVPGLLQDKDDESTLIKEINKNTIEDFLSLAQGTMKKKVLGAMEAVDKGVKRVIFADGRVTHPIQNALKGKGTVIS